MSSSKNKPLSGAICGAGIVAAACLAIAAVPALAGSGLVPTKAISISGVPGATGTVSSFDISFVDPVSHTYILGDRTNNGVDVIDTRTNTLRFIAGQGQFKGVVAVCAVANSCSGPNGVLIVNPTVDSNGNVTGGEIWAGDAGAGLTSGPGCTAPSQCSSVKVYDLKTGQTQIANINTGGQFRADEMCFDPVDNLVMATNNADSPPYANIIDVSTHTIVAQIPWFQNSNGAEQCLYDARTGLFYETAPEYTPGPNGYLTGPGNNSNPGAVNAVDPRIARAQNFTGSGHIPGPMQGNDIPIVATYVIPLTACDGPQGMAIGPGSGLLVGCNGGPASALSNDASIVMDDGSSGGTPGSVLAELVNQDGPDEVDYNPSSNLYTFARSTKTVTNLTGTIGMVNATSLVPDISINTVATSGGAHSVAASSDTRNTYVPIPIASQASKLCSSVGGVDANGCILVLTRQVSNTHDSNGDTASDVLWRDASGNVGSWLMKAANCSNLQAANTGAAGIGSTTVFGQVPTTWQIVGQRDFVGTGSSSILWRDSVGDVAIWLMGVGNNGGGTTCNMAGGGISGVASLGPVPTTLSVVGTGEFNANGKGDILWQDTSGNLTVTLMNGTTMTGQRSIGKLPAGYTVVGADRRGWIFLNNPTTNDVTIWVVGCPGSSSTCTVTATDIGTAPGAWKIKALGDLDGNGTTDIAWMDTSSNVGAWFLKDVGGTPTFIGSKVYGSVGPQWSIAQTGDMNGDGTADILWTDTSGNVGAWFLTGNAGSNTISAVSAYGNVGTSWQVQSLNSQ
jgi:VCBS repeat protein